MKITLLQCFLLLFEANLFRVLVKCQKFITLPFFIYSNRFLLSTKGALCYVCGMCSYELKSKTNSFVSRKTKLSLYFSVSNRMGYFVQVKSTPCKLIANVLRMLQNFRYIFPSVLIAFCSGLNMKLCLRFPCISMCNKIVMCHDKCKLAKTSLNFSHIIHMK